MGDQWYTKKWLGAGLHLLFWALIFSFPFLLRPIIDSNKVSHVQPTWAAFYQLSFSNNLIRVALFYSNAFIFIPRLIYKRKYWQYILVLLTALMIMLACDRLFFRLYLSNSGYRIWNYFVFNLPFFAFIIISSAAFRMIKDRVQENQRNKEKETENLKTELSLLRSQVSPHFMFNVLNNMVAMARKKSDLLEPSLIKLSGLLRYMLYETQEQVPLEKETEYLQSYIDLQRQRFGNNVSIQASLGKVDETYNIEPMLLIPFVENAFKHGPGAAGAEIQIDLKAENNILNFVVRNTYQDTPSEAKDETHGIGLANVQRRLALLYRNKHSLLITKQKGWFIASLQIILN